MQRKKNKDYYQNTVELGSAIIPSVRMRKMTTKKLLKYLIFIIIGYIVYSVYQKYNMASNTSSRSEVRWNNDKETGDSNDTPESHKRLKEQVNKVLEDFKEKQNRQAEEDVFEDFNVQNGILQEDEIKANDDKNVDEAFGVEDKNVDLNEIPDDVFEDVDEQEEKADLELELEIEELLADAFKDTVDEMADKEAEDLEKKETDEKVEENIPKNVVEQEMKKIIAQKNFIEPDGRDLKANLALKQYQEFNMAVDKYGKRLHPLEIKRRNEEAARKAARHDDDHEFPPFVTAVRQTTYKQVEQLVASVQQHLPGRKVYVYDLDLEKDQKKQLMSICGVRLRLFMKKLFPNFVSNLDNLHWKPLVIQTALAEFGHITWINPQFRLGTSELAALVHESHEKGIIVIGQSVSYTTYAATHPDMLKFIGSDTQKLSLHPHIEMRAMMIHNKPEVHENFMKVFVACAMEETCLAPPGAKWQCKFDFTGRKPAGCHRFDESALNILLKKWFDFDSTVFLRRNNYFRPYDDHYRPKLKYCRKAEDIKDTEL